MSNKDYEVPDGMAKAIWEHKYARVKDDGEYQSWVERVEEVVAGNFSLVGPDIFPALSYQRTVELARKGVMPFSGRHLQHGDLDQVNKLGETMTNCSTAMLSFLKFWLLMKGSGVGRLYDSDICRVNWDNMPNCRFVLEEPNYITGSPGHQDYEDWVEGSREAKHKYDSESENVRWFTVEDSAEGWVKVVEILETAAWQEKHRDKLFIFDFSDIRHSGTPIMGQQNRPSSGPIPLMKALLEIATLKGLGMKPWKQAMFVDHYLAACVALGGVRRAARIACKGWREKDIFEFIDIKRGGWLTSANNSVMVDAEFWGLAASAAPSHARRVFEAMTSAAYFDKTGEPAYINVDRLSWDDTGSEGITKENFFGGVGESLLSPHANTYLMVGGLLSAISRKKYPFLVNPCVTGDTWVHTNRGPRQVVDLLAKEFVAVVNGEEYAATPFFSTGTKEVFRVSSTRGHYFDATANHKVKLSAGEGIAWTQVEDLEVGDRLVINKHSAYSWGSGGDIEHGWLVGQVLGDGGFNPSKYPPYLRFWGDNQAYMGRLASDRIKGLVKTKADFSEGSKNKINKCTTVACVGLTTLVSPFLKEGTKEVTNALDESSSSFHIGFLRGLFDTGGSVQGGLVKGVSIRLFQVNVDVLRLAQRMLTRLGVMSTIHMGRRLPGFTSMPDGRGGKKEYPTKGLHELVVSRESFDKFFYTIGLDDLEKRARMEGLISSRTRSAYADKITTEVTKVISLGEREVFDTTVDTVHEFDGNGVSLHNCGEIVLSAAGGYCVIGDICLANSTVEEALDAAYLMSQFLIRTNTMEFLYSSEVSRTNRIGVGITGIFEFAYTHFGFTFFDLIDEDISSNFWSFVEKMRVKAQEGAAYAANLLNMTIPHTVTTTKPSGTVSKVMVCTEGAHLPAYAFYMRWVQYPVGDPDLDDLVLRGYPVKDVSSVFPGRHVVGFPTELPIATMQGDDVVVASDATPEQQFEWLRLLEKYWLGGVGNNNQISYTLKYDPTVVSYAELTKVILDNQKTVRCCAIMPQEDTSAYIYTPEERISKEEYDIAMSRITSVVKKEAYDAEHLSCGVGGCPIELDINK